MHNALEGNAEDHFRYILNLTKESAYSKPPPPPAFTYKFTKIDIMEPPFPNGMSDKDVKQVGQIHLLLTAPFAGVDDTGAIVDQTLLDNSIISLGRSLDNKKMITLMFVCSDLKLLPLKKPRFYKRDWIECLVEWVCAIFH